MRKRENFGRFYTLRMRIVYQHPLERLVALSLLCWCCASHSHPHRRRNARLLLVNNTRTWQSFVSVMKKTLNIAKDFYVEHRPSSKAQLFFSSLWRNIKILILFIAQHTSERFDASFESHFQLRFRCSPLINFFTLAQKLFFELQSDDQSDTQY